MTPDLEHSDWIDPAKLRQSMLNAASREDDLAHAQGWMTTPVAAVLAAALNALLTDDEAMQNLVRVARHDGRGSWQARGREALRAAVEGR